MGPIPPILSDFSSILKTGDLRAYLDQYLLNRGSPSFLASLQDHLRAPSTPDSSESYNLSLVNSLVMYIGVSSVAQAKARSGSSLFVASDPGAVALQYLATNLDVEGMLLLVHHFRVYSRTTRSTSFAQRDAAALTISQCTHPLVWLFNASPLPRG